MSKLKFSIIFWESWKRNHFNNFRQKIILISFASKSGSALHNNRVEWFMLWSIILQLSDFLYIKGTEIPVLIHFPTKKQGLNLYMKIYQIAVRTFFFSFIWFIVFYLIMLHMSVLCLGKVLYILKCDQFEKTKQSKHFYKRRQ